MRCPFVKEDGKKCNKKLKLTDFQCSYCKIKFCAIHRLPERHNCKHDFTMDKSKLEKENPVIAPKKLEKI